MASSMTPNGCAERRAAQRSTSARVRPMQNPMRRLTTFTAVALVLATAPAAHAKTTRGNWNLAQQEAVADEGVLPRLADGRFHGERPLTGAQLSNALTVITG